MIYTPRVSAAAILDGTPLAGADVVGFDFSGISFSGQGFSGMQFDGITLASVGFTTTDLRTTSYLGGFQNSAWELFHYLYRMRSGTEASPKKANRRVVGSGTSVHPAVTGLKRKAPPPHSGQPVHEFEKFVNSS